MRKLRSVLFLSVLVAVGAIGTEAAPSRQPFQIRVVSKPSRVIAGASHVFTVEIKNKSGAPLTLSSLFAFSWSVEWNNPDGSGEGSFSGPGTKTIIGTDLNPATGEITCKYSHYDRDDFFTLAVDATKRFDIDVRIPQGCDAGKASVTIEFESKYDGSEIGISAWSGKAQPIKLNIQVTNNPVPQQRPRTNAG